MTHPPRGRDGSPSVAALAVQVSGLRRDIEALAARVDVLKRTQEEHAVVLEGITELRSQVEQILALVSEDDKASSSGWFWLTMDEQGRDEKAGELLDWVETVLRTQYPDYLADQIRPCGANHSEARWELAWLYQLWCAAYLVKNRRGRLPRTGTARGRTACLPTKPRTRLAATDNITGVECLGE